MSLYTDALSKLGRNFYVQEVHLKIMYIFESYICPN